MSPSRAEIDAVLSTMTRLRNTVAWWASPQVAEAVLTAAEEARNG